jgi:choline dehydrogenase
MTYDYIIVGAGSAGCVLASRLSEDPGINVLLLEAGRPDTNKYIHIPAAFSKLYKTRYDWEFYTEPEPQLGNRKVYWPRGKVLGGCSSINAMIYVRGHREDFDCWRGLGNDGWGYADVLPYFKKSEHQQRGASEFHGCGGPLQVTDLRWTNPLSHAFVEAAGKTGFTHNADFNGASQEGVGFYQVTQRRGARHSAADAFLRPAMRRANLAVATQVQVTGILFEGQRASGVSFRKNGEIFEVRAQREVLLCAGAVGSPHLLLLSGIGPGDHLRKHGIGVRCDLPGVGGNLQDHVVAPVAGECAQPVGMERRESLGNLLRYICARGGPLSSNVGEVGGFVRTHYASTAPDVQFIFAAAYFLNHGFDKFAGDAFTLGAILLRPQSRGRILLRSADPLDAPAIHANYLTETRDPEVLMEAVKMARAIVCGEAFGKHSRRELCPGAEAKNGAALCKHITNTAQTLYHPVGTCKMGSDADSVVDSELRVHGVEGVRVVDASVMPTIPGGNTNAPTIMIAERAADLIRSATQRVLVHDAVTARALRNAVPAVR